MGITELLHWWVPDVKFSGDKVVLEKWQCWQPWAKHQHQRQYLTWLHLYDFELKLFNKWCWPTLVKYRLPQTHFAVYSFTNRPVCVSPSIWTHTTFFHWVAPPHHKDKWNINHHSGTQIPSAISVSSANVQMEFYQSYGNFLNSDVERNIPIVSSKVLKLMTYCMLFK